MEQDLNPVRSGDDRQQPMTMNSPETLSVIEQVNAASNGVNQRLTALEQKVERIWHSVESTRKMYLWSLIIGIALFVLPLIALGFVIPQYLKSLDIQSLLQ